MMGCGCMIADIDSEVFFLLRDFKQIQLDKGQPKPDFQKHLLNNGLMLATACMCCDTRTNTLRAPDISPVDNIGMCEV